MGGARIHTSQSYSWRSLTNNRGSRQRTLFDGGAVGNDRAGVAGDSQKMLGKCEDAVQNVQECSILSVARLRALRARYRSLSDATSHWLNLTDVQPGWVMSVWIVWWTRRLTRTRASGLLTIAINVVHSALYA